MTTSPILLLDVMSTLVYDPFAVEMPAFFEMSLEELIARKHPDAWVRFERDEIDEQTFFDVFFPDGPAIDGEAFRAMLHDSYRFLDGIEELLAELHEAGVEMHALSNYPVWWEIIEHELSLSRFLSWSFVSCKTGVRKPDAGAYLGAAGALEVDPGRCLFVDDRRSNCDAARATGMDAVRFTGAAALREALAARGVLTP